MVGGNSTSGTDNLESGDDESARLISVNLSARSTRRSTNLLFAEVIIVMTDNRIKNRTVHMKRRVYVRLFAELVGAVGLDRLEVFLSTATAFFVPAYDEELSGVEIKSPERQARCLRAKNFPGRNAFRLCAQSRRRLSCPRRME